MVKFSQSVTLAQKLVQIDTRNPGGNETQAIQLLADILRKAGFTVTLSFFEEGRPSLIARYGTGTNPSLCFAGHIDTVPFGLRKWSHNPLQGVIANGKLYGRGSCDMKSGIAAMVVAACELVPLLKEGEDLVLIVVAGEETGCEGSKFLAQQKELLGTPGALVVTEPSSNYPLVGHKGALWLSAKYEGKAAHGSMPEQGDNAIYKAVHGIEQIKQFNLGTKAHQHLGLPTLNVGYFNGGLNINSVPDIAEFGIDIRTIPEVDHDELQQKINITLGEDVQISTILDVTPLWTDPNGEWVQKVFALVEPIINEKPVAKTVAFFTDGAPLHATFDGIPTLILGPGSSAMAHQTDEYCHIKEIDDATQIYQAIIKDWYGISA